MKSKILIVDDELSQTALLKGFLEKKGYKVTAEQNPLNAINLIKNQEFDLMIAEVSLKQVFSEYWLTGDMVQDRDDRCRILKRPLAELLELNWCAAFPHPISGIEFILPRDVLRFRHQPISAIAKLDVIPVDSIVLRQDQIA